MKKVIILLVTVMTTLQLHAQDPNFWIFLCFGQSNMAGQAPIEAQDLAVNDRYLSMATTDGNDRQLGTWRKAIPPLCRADAHLGPADWFGRTLLDVVPENVRIGIVSVAVEGCPITFFDKDKNAPLIAKEERDWMNGILNQYGRDPYERLLSMAKIAAKDGVIKGILLHQGCSNCGDPNWPNMVKKIYNDMLKDLGLNAADVPLFVGEVEYADMGGGCASHNVQVDRLPSVIPTAYVVSAKNLPGNGTDPWHFSAQGYRVLGMRYAQQALRVIYDIDPDYDDPFLPTTEKGINERFTTLTSISGKPFAIVNEAEAKAFYCTFGQHLGYADFRTAFKETNSSYFFKIQKTSGGFRLRLVTPEGNDYQVGGETGYLNSPSVDGNSCFVGGLNGQNGYDIPKGAVWVMEYVDGKGFSIKNVGTGKYLKDASSPAKYDEPTYFTFCTLGVSAGIDLPVADARTSDVYTLQGVKAGTKEQWSSLPQGIYIVGGKLKVKK